MKKSEKRQSNIEILRILLTLMVITVHYNSNGLTGGAFSVVKHGTLGLEFVCKKMGFPMWDYSNCFVIGFSIFLFNFFRKTKLNLGVFDKYILWISKACFGVYIIHTKAIIEGTFWKICSLYDMSDGKVVAVIGNYIISIGATFIMCVVIDSLYRFLLHPILEKVEKRKIIINVG